MSIVFLNSSSVHLSCPEWPSIPDPVSSGLQRAACVPSAHPSGEDNKIKIKYILPASKFNLHMHGEDDYNPCCCCPGQIAWPLILPWQPGSIFKTIFKTTLLMRRRRTISSANSKRLSCFVRPQPAVNCCWRSDLNVVLMNAPQYLARTVIIIVSSYLLNFILTISACIIIISNYITF